jgi:hypothetical protein
VNIDVEVLLLDALVRAVFQHRINGLIDFLAQGNVVLAKADTRPFAECCRIANILTGKAVAAALRCL